jgi:hypothetical protein
MVIQKIHNVLNKYPFHYNLGVHTTNYLFASQIISLVLGVCWLDISILYLVEAGASTFL